MRERIPDPQALATFERSKLDWEERTRDPHRGTLAWYRHLLGLRRTEPAMAWSAAASQRAVALDGDTVALRRQNGDAAALLVCRLRGAVATVEVPAAFDPPPGRIWRQVLTTEDPAFAADPHPIEAAAGMPLSCTFERPGAVLWLAAPPENM
jgi:maltooligosyltrehalose trehalohydrolase